MVVLWVVVVMMVVVAMRLGDVVWVKWQCLNRGVGARVQQGVCAGHVATQSMG